MIVWSKLENDAQQAALQRPALSDSPQRQQTVAQMLNTVREQGDSAVQSYNAQFNPEGISTLAVSDEEHQAGIAELTQDVKLAIDEAYQNIYQFHLAQQPHDIAVTTMSGVQCEIRSRAIERVGLYIPGGSAPLPSTVLMLGVPAQIAGCSQVVLCTPTQGSAEIHPAILYAAQRCGISQIFRVGGAQAIAAMAYGTETIPKVDKIYGPGNSYVTEAKQQVSQQAYGAAIDMPAGPSEVLVVADADAKPAFIAADLLSQAEHGPDSQTVLVATCEQVIAQTQAAITEQLKVLPRAEIAKQSITNSRFILASDLTEAIAITNQYAPEHLIVQVNNAAAITDKFTSAGSIFVGEWTPESVGDYASGTNHVLPTYGYSRVVSSLSLVDFYRRYTVQQLSANGLQTLGQTVMTLADAEGLDAHKRAVEIRLDSLSTTNTSDQQPSSENDWISAKVAPHIQALTPYQSASRDWQTEELWLNANESPFGLNIQANATRANRYPEFQPPNLINGYADYAGVTIQQLIATRGADEGIDLLMRAFCTPNKDSVIHCSPTYGMYTVTAATQGVVLIDVPQAEDWTWDISGIDHAIQPHTKLVFICSPNNPTGQRISQAQLHELLAVVDGRCLLVVDEAYIEFSEQESLVSELANYPHLVLLRTLSKAFGLAGLRCGFVLANTPVINALKKVSSPYPISLPVADIAAQALSKDGLITMRNTVNTLNTLKAETLTWLSALNGVEHIFPSEANYILFNYRWQPEMLSALKEQHILLRDQSKQPRLSKAIRISIGSTEEMQQLKAAMQHIDASLRASCINDKQGATDPDQQQSNT